MELGFIRRNVEQPIPNQNPTRNIVEGWRRVINKHPPHGLLQLNKSACSFIIQGRETVARLNSLGFSTSGEERLVIGTGGTETKRN